MDSQHNWNYKQWFALLRARTDSFIASYCESGGNEYSVLCDSYETCLSSLNRMPRLWIMYLEFLVENRDITRFRRTVNLALQSLPITQHERIWDVVMNRFIYQTEFAVPLLTSKTLYKRYIQLSPASRDDYIDFLIEREDFADAVIELLNVIHSEDDNSLHYMNYFKLVNIISKNSNKLSNLVVSDVDLPSIIRAGLSKFPDEIGNLWNHLADYYIRLGLFTKAIEIYEEALESVRAVVDFSVVFNSYQSFLDLLLKTKIEQGSPDVEMELMRLELLLDRRSEILSQVLLRQNPNNVIEWVKRTKLVRIANFPDKVISTFETAIETIDPTSPNLVGKLSQIWIEYAKYFHENVETTRSVFQKAINYPFRHVDELANVWIEWILFEVRQFIQKGGDTTSLMEIAHRAINQYRGSPKATIQSQLFKSVKLWNLVLDLEESFSGESNPDLVRAIYETMIELKVITPLLLLDYSRFEYRRNFFEKSVQILQKGISLFPWPNCRDIWIYYLDQVANIQRKRYSVERIRDLLESAICDCPKEHVGVFYFQFYKFELEEGFSGDAIGVLRRAVTALMTVPASAMGFINLALAECMRIEGAVGVRRIFEDAIQTFSKNDKLVIEFCMEYCGFEQRLGQLERGRKLLAHGSQYANPKKFEYFWDFWKNYEISHGNEETYKNMKRVRRAVEIAFSDKHFNTLDVGTELMEDEPTNPNTVEVSSAPKLVVGIDLSKLQAAAGGIGSEGGGFVAASSFQGSRPGYVFKTGPQGLGYYKD
jgi:pre-mRNA-splicing factor SYF1